MIMVGELQCQELPRRRHLHLVLQQLADLDIAAEQLLHLNCGSLHDHLHAPLPHGLRDPAVLGHQHGGQPEDQPALCLPHHSYRFCTEYIQFMRNA